MMNREWLWDRKITTQQVKQILKNPRHREFAQIASLLLARNNEPRQVFNEFLDPLIFCRQWQRLKKRMRRDKWNSQRIAFWESIFEKLKEKYKEEGVSLRQKSGRPRSSVCHKVGGKLHKIRTEKGLSQKELAKKLSISQQIISRIEKWKENVSLITLNKITQALGKNLRIDFE